MRPRQIASENPTLGGYRFTDGVASMRPRQIASENEQLVGVRADRGVASMRPRQIASENPGEATVGPIKPPCFNEAEADRLGKLADAAHRTHHLAELQ